MQPKVQALKLLPFVKRICLDNISSIVCGDVLVWSLADSRKIELLAVRLCGLAETNDVCKHRFFYIVKSLSMY